MRKEDHVKRATRAAEINGLYLRLSKLRKAALATPATVIFEEDVTVAVPLPTLDRCMRELRAAVRLLDPEPRDRAPLALEGPPPFQAHSETDATSEELARYENEGGLSPGKACLSGEREG